MGQMVVTRQYQQPIKLTGGSLDSSTTAWINAVVTAGGSVSAPRQTIVNTLIVALKSAGLFTKLDRLWLLASESSIQAGIDIVNLGTFTIHGTPTFAADNGYVSNVANTDYIDTGFVPSTAGGNYSQDSASFGAYNLTSNTASDSGALMGIDLSGSWTSFILPNQGSSTFIDVNDTTFPSAAALNHQGFWAASRTGPTTVNGYRNGSATPIVTSAAGSTGNPTISFYILATNNSAGANHGTSGDHLAAAFIGGGLTATDYVNLSNALNGGYMTSVGGNISVY